MYVHITYIFVWQPNSATKTHAHAHIFASRREMRVFSLTSHVSLDKKTYLPLGLSMLVDMSQQYPQADQYAFLASLIQIDPDPMAGPQP